jgi:hypothetical protein
MTRQSFAAIVGTGLILATAFTGVVARQGGNAAVAIDADDIGGVVTSAKGPEAGVWVIAQTADLPTKFIRIVVTDDRGRYVIPDLPNANYDVWVRGYGLVDSPKVKSAPGKHVNLTAVNAPNPSAAAQYYPANYWYALLEPPPKSDFPGTGRNGNGIPEVNKTQGAWIGNIKMTNACTQCHQMGTKVTRELPPDLKEKFKNSVDAWGYRLEIGISGAFMNSTLGPLGRNRALKVFASWSDRIEKGEVPPVPPPRPSGVERNIVVTEWEWANSKRFTHDEISTDRRNPTLNGYGPVVGVEELSGDFITVLDPVKNAAKEVPVPLYDPTLKVTWSDNSVPNPSRYWGEELIWQSKMAPHNPMFDSKGRVWITARGGCRVFDPKTDKVIRLEGCPVGHHLQFADDDVLWGDGGGGAWFDTKLWDKTGDDSKAGGRIVRVMDTNGNGKLDEGWVASDQPVDPKKDKAFDPGQAYAVIPNPIDGSVWISYSVIPGGITRYDPKTKLSEYYEVPYMNKNAKIEGFLPHGIDIDRSTGVIWTGLNSGHYAEFDRRKCRVTNGPTATGQHCPEGWTLHLAPGPNFKTVEASGTSDSYYLNWVDWHNSSGFGDNTPLLTGTSSDALYAWVNGKWVVLRVPYPLGFHPRGMDGRIDDPKAGWKGRGLWSTHAAQASWHQEGGKSERPKVIHFQIRPDPLAK